MSLKVTDKEIIIPFISEEFDAVLVAGLLDVRERTIANDSKHPEDVAYNDRLMEALDVVLDYFGVQNAD